MGKVPQMHFPVIWTVYGHFPRPWWETHLQINPNQSSELWKDLPLRLMVNRFQRSSQVQFPSCWPWPGVLIYYLKRKHHKYGTEFEKHPLYTVSLWLEISCKAVLYFWNSFSVNLFFAYLGVRLLEKLVKALHSEGSWSKPQPWYKALSYLELN